ncbi:Tripartite ATP-independent periplasmic transporters, DctQ component [Pseudooceanicola marinus]|uniref:TRAP transporter small permease protein n=1 Tax=Pseudooceanicola marinus TaxID=396013 RepID=A0A1X6Y7S0_9RHOB|nr:TRAP transporter small permease [Pseudooceanicola marinus]PJE33219.1 TRAP transporter small permease [Pseudooceanicola marinus]SLN13117.1 Tripartite ATP-independent periplasmic transporters, DctQ component [Pseudooceanicola marinus]
MTDKDPRTSGAGTRHRPVAADARPGSRANTRASSWASGWARAWGAVVNALAAFGTALIAGLMLLICADIVARNGMGASLPLVSELGALLLVMIVCLQFGATIRADRLARAGLFLDPLRQRRPRISAALEAVFSLVGAVMIGLMAWATFGVLTTDWERREFIGTPGLGTLPTWPFRLFILLGLTVAAVEFAVRSVRSLRSAAGFSEVTR